MYPPKRQHPPCGPVNLRRWELNKLRRDHKRQHDGDGIPPEEIPVVMHLALELLDDTALVLPQAIPQLPAHLHQFTEASSADANHEVS